MEQHHWRDRPYPNPPVTMGQDMYPSTYPHDPETQPDTSQFYDPYHLNGFELSVASDENIMPANRQPLRLNETDNSAHGSQSPFPNPQHSGSSFEQGPHDDVIIPDKNVKSALSNYQ